MIGVTGHAGVAGLTCVGDRLRQLMWALGSPLAVFENKESAKFGTRHCRTPKSSRLTFVLPMRSGANG